MVLEFDSTLSAFLEDSPATYEVIFGYTTEIMTRAHEYGFDDYAEPQELLMENKYWDATLKVSQQAFDFYGATCV